MKRLAQLFKRQKLEAAAGDLQLVLFDVQVCSVAFWDVQVFFGLWFLLFRMFLFLCLFMDFEGTSLLG